MDKAFIQLCEQAIAGEKRTAKQVSQALTDAIRSGERNLTTLSHLVEPLWDTMQGLSGIGTKTYQRYLRYVATFNPKEAQTLRAHYEDSMGYKLLAVYVAADLASDWHEGETDSDGQDYLTTYLAKISRHCPDWKSKVVSFLHNPQKKRHRTVEATLAALKQRLCDVQKQPQQAEALIDRYESMIDILPHEQFHPLTQEEYAELAEALQLLDPETAPSRTAYIERLRGHEIAIQVRLSELKHRIEQRNSHTPDRPTPEEQEYKQLLDLLWELYPHQQHE